MCSPCPRPYIAVAVAINTTVRGEIRTRVLSHCSRTLYHQITATATAILVRYLLSSSVRPSVRHKPVLYRNDWTNRAGFWHGSFFSIFHLCCKESWVGPSPNITVLPSGTLSRTLDLENFATASRSRCQQEALLSQTGRVGEILTDSTSRSPSAVAELLVFHIVQ